MHYFKDPQGTGTIRGQEVVFLVLVTLVVTIPVGFVFYQPDPLYSAWARQDKRLKKQGLPKSKRPPKPAFNPDYPSKHQLALRLLEQFAREHPEVNVKAVLADALYGNAEFMRQAAQVWDHVQVISQLRPQQKVYYRGRSWRIDEYFQAYPGVAQTLRVRGGKTVDVVIGSARLYVEAHECKRFIIALRYPDETDYRYLVASDLSWRTGDIAQAHTLRWLVEIYQPCNLLKSPERFQKRTMAVATSAVLSAMPAAVRVLRRRPRLAKWNVLRTWRAVLEAGLAVTTDRGWAAACPV